MLRFIIPLLLFSVGVSGLLWTSPNIVTNATSFTAIGNTSQLTVVWEDQSFLHQGVSYDNGTTWIYSSLTSGSHPKMKINSNGTTVLIYNSGNVTMINRNGVIVAQFPGTNPLNYTLATGISPGITLNNQDWVGCWEDQGSIRCTSSTNDGVNWTTAYSITTGTSPSVYKGDNYWLMYFYQSGHLYYYYGVVPTWTLYGPAKMNVVTNPISDMASNKSITAATFSGGFLATATAGTGAASSGSHPINSTYSSLSYTGIWVIIGGDRQLQSYWSTDLVNWTVDQVDSQFSEYHQNQLISFSSDSHVALFIDGNGTLWTIRSFIQPVISTPSPLTLISVDTQLNGSFVLNSSLILQANLSITGDLNLTTQSTLEFSGNGSIWVNGTVAFGGQLIVTGGPQRLMTFNSSSGNFSNITLTPCHILEYSQSSLSMIFDFQCVPGNSGIPLWVFIVIGSVAAAILIAVIISLVFFRKRIFPHRKQAKEALSQLQKVKSRQRPIERRDRA